MKKAYCIRGKAELQQTSASSQQLNRVHFTLRIVILKWQAWLKQSAIEALRLKYMQTSFGKTSKFLISCRINVQVEERSQG